jgi:cysteinyl-tRNA synthetase
MSHALLGAPFDIHGGGYDLIFPHHENEIAQSEAVLPAPPMANVWMHGGLLQFDGKKMSKSLGNFEPLSSLLDRHDPQAIRLLFLQTGYRKPMNFTEASIDAASVGLRKLFGAYDTLRTADVSQHAAREEASAGLAALVERFARALDDDFNTAGAVSVLFDLANETNAWRERGVASEAAAFVHQALEILGLSPHERARQPVATAPASERVHAVDESAFVIRAGSDAAAKIGLARFDALRGALAAIADGAPDDAALRASFSAALGAASGGDTLEAHARSIERAIEARYRAKKAKDFALADRVRDALREAGVTITDTKGGASWTVDA